MSDYQPGQCVATQGCESQAAPGLLVCRGHLERLGAMLRDVEDQAALLDAVPSMQQQSGNGGGSLASERAPVRLDVLIHLDPRSRPAGQRLPGPACPACWHESCAHIRAWLDAYDARATETLSVLDVLHGWARLVREERDLTSPERITVVGEVGTLTFHRDWICEQLWVDEVFAELSQLLSQLRAVNGTGPDRPFGRCPRIVDGEPCAGQVWIHDELQPVWRRYIDRCSQTWEQAPGAAVCDTCGTTWKTEADKARLRTMIDDRGSERMLTAEELADRLGKSVNAVRILAHRAGVKAVAGRYDAQALGLASDVA